jgi:hypothetical protein
MDNNFPHISQIQQSRSRHVQSASTDPSPPLQAPQSPAILRGRPPALHFHVGTTPGLNNAHAQPHHSPGPLLSPAPVDVVSPNAVFGSSEVPTFGPYPALHNIPSHVSPRHQHHQPQPSVCFPPKPQQHRGPGASSALISNVGQAAPGDEPCIGAASSHGPLSGLASRSPGLVSPRRERLEGREDALALVQPDDGDSEGNDGASNLTSLPGALGSDGHVGGDSHLRVQNFVQNPPELAAWRHKLFDLEDMVVLNDEECVRVLLPHTSLSKLTPNPTQIQYVLALGGQCLFSPFNATLQTEALRQSLL